MKQQKLPDIKVILRAIEAQKNTKDWQKDNGQYIPYPSTWLNAEGWLDEVKDHFSDNIHKTLTIEEIEAMQNAN